MAVVNDISALESAMMKEVHSLMKQSQSELIQEIQESIDETVYSYKPKLYKRTESLKKTLRLNRDPSKTFCSGNQASITIDHNVKKAKWKYVKSGKPCYDVPEIVTEGSYGSFVGKGADGAYHNINPSAPNSKEWSRPRDYMGDAENKLDGNGYLNRCLKPYLPSYMTIK